MAQVSVEINNRKYQIACDDGQEAHLTRLSGYINDRVKELVASVGQIGDSHLLVMASLLVADELSDTYSDLVSLRDTNPTAANRFKALEELADDLNSLAERIENVAETVETS